MEVSKPKAQENTKCKKKIPPGSLIGVMYGCNGVRERCIGVSLPKAYRDVSLVKQNKHTTSEKYSKWVFIVKKQQKEFQRNHIYRWGVEITTLSDIKLRSTADMNKLYKPQRY